MDLLYCHILCISETELKLVEQSQFLTDENTIPTNIVQLQYL